MKKGTKKKKEERKNKWQKSGGEGGREEGKERESRRYYECPCKIIWKIDSDIPFYSLSQIPSPTSQ